MISYSRQGDLMARTIVKQRAAVEGMPYKAIDVTMQSINQHAFVVGLLDDQFDIELCRQLPKSGIDVIQGEVAIDMRFPSAREV